MPPINPRSSRRTPAEQEAINSRWREVQRSLSGGGRRVPERGARVDTRRPETPPVGTMATRNGQPVMWKGPSGWGRPPSEVVGVQENGRPTPPVGQIATKNGKPVMWKGPSGWGTPPSEAMGVPATPTSAPIAGRPSSTPQGQPSAGRPTPPPSPQVSGAPTPRFIPSPGGMQPVASPATTSNPFAPGFGSTAGIGFSKESLARSIAGDGWTNPGVVQQAGNTAGEIAFNEKVSNPFVSSQFNQLASGPSLLSPDQPSVPPGFQIAGSLLPQSQPLTGTLFNAAGSVPNAYGSSGVVQASLTTPEPAAPEAAAQSMASDAVNQVMSLQNRIRENRGMPLIVE